MTNVTMTKREVLTAIAAIVAGMDGIPYSFNRVKKSGANITTESIETDVKDAILAYAENEIALLDKKATAAKSQKSKTQKENEGIKDNIVNALTLLGRSVTVTELIKEGEGMSNLSCQKLSALLSQLKEEGRVGKAINGKSSLFYAA